MTGARLLSTFILAALPLTAHAQSSESANPNPLCAIVVSVVQFTNALPGEGTWLPADGEQRRSARLKGEPVLGEGRTDWGRWPCNWKTEGLPNPLYTGEARSLAFSTPVYVADGKAAFIRMEERFVHNAYARRVYRLENDGGRWRVTDHRFEGGGTGIEY